MALLEGNVPWWVSSIPIPARRVHGTLYRSPAATYSARMPAGMGAAGVVREFRRGVPAAGRSNPIPPSSPAGTGLVGDGCGGSPVQRCPALGHERLRVDRDVVVEDLEVEVVAGGGPGGPLHPEPLPGGDRGADGDPALDAGEVGVPGGDPAAVVDVDGVAVGPAPPGGGDHTGGGCEDGAGPGLGDQVGPGVQLPPVVDGVEPGPVPGGAHVGLGERGPPLPRRGNGGAARVEAELFGGGGGDHGGGDQRGRERDREQGGNDRGQDPPHGLHNESSSAVGVLMRRR